ncbi:dihydroneopterin aldolase [Chloroflexi bacterium CFX6]|nr:dihydroneopterin aldolase [Chloroflexi bacterium CFX6]
MGTPAQIGKNEYKAALAQGREANREVRKLLRRMMQESSSNLIQALAGRIAMAVSENDEAMERLDEIGKTWKAGK